MKYFLFFILISSAFFLAIPVNAEKIEINSTPILSKGTCLGDDNCFNNTFCDIQTIDKLKMQNIKDFCYGKQICDLTDVPIISYFVVPPCAPKFEIGKECYKNEQCLSNNCGTGQGKEKKCIASDTGAGYLKFTPTAPTLEVDVPTLQPFTTAGMEKPDAEGNIYIPFIGQYIVGIYKWALLVAGIIATVMIILGGFTYLTSGGDATQAGQGKERITGAVFGLILLVSSYMILYLINPDLVKFKSLKINVIKPIELDIVKAGSDNGAAADGVSASCLTESETGIIPTEIAKEGDRSIHKDMISPLQKASELAQKNGKILQITIHGGFRTMAEQEKKWQEALTKYGSEDAARKKVAKPSCNAPHLTGRAIDICFKNNLICGKITGEFANFSNDDVFLLQNIMKEAGFKRYCAEWWHFEYNLSASSNRCSP